jgi:UDP-N-acetylmuramate--alanine ligase
LLDAGGLDPTVINGGIINAYGTNARMGDGEWMVVEADESDGTFLKLPAEIAVVTNIDPEHLDHYGNFDKVREAFRQFVENVPFYGFGVMCPITPEVQALVGRIEDRRSSPMARTRRPTCASPMSASMAVPFRSSTWRSATADRRPD